MGASALWCACCGSLSSGLDQVPFQLPEAHLHTGKSDPAKYQGMPQKVLCVFLWLLYAGAAGVLTFDGPYTTTGNGYFFSWGGFAASCHACYLAIDLIHNMVHATKSQAEMMQMEKRMIIGCLLFSIIELVESCVQCDKYDCSDKIAYGVAMGVIGVIFSAVLLIGYNALINLMPYLAFLLSILWGIAAVVLTFKGGPYNITGNGYFSSWGAFVCAFGLTFLTSRHMVSQKLAEFSGDDVRPCMLSR